MELPRQGLIIDEPYISQILSGEKTWEMRSMRTGKREVIGLIKKSTKHIFGTAELYDCEGPLSFEQLLELTDKHGISKGKVEQGLLDKWNYAWKLRNITEFAEPIPYEHPNGAVTWVNLTAQSNNKNIRLTRPLQNTSVVKNTAPENRVPPSEKKQSANELQSKRTEMGVLPYAKDGTNFSPRLAKNGYFTVGAKGDEQKIESFDKALDYLKAMDVAKWRRPNPKGNWGIVSAVEWKQS